MEEYEKDGERPPSDASRRISSQPVLQLNQWHVILRGELCVMPPPNSPHQPLFLHVFEKEDGFEL